MVLMAKTWKKTVKPFRDCLRLLQAPAPIATRTQLHLNHSQKLEKFGRPTKVPNLTLHYSIFSFEFIYVSTPCIHFFFSIRWSKMLALQNYDISENKRYGFLILLNHFLIAWTQTSLIHQLQSRFDLLGSFSTFSWWQRCKQIIHEFVVILRHKCHPAQQEQAQHSNIHVLKNAVIDL